MRAAASKVHTSTQEQQSGDPSSRLASLMAFLVKDFSTSSPRYLRASTDAFVSFVNALRPPISASPADAVFALPLP